MNRTGSRGTAPSSSVLWLALGRTTPRSIQSLLQFLGLGVAFLFGMVVQNYLHVAHHLSSFDSSSIFPGDFLEKSKIEIEIKPPIRHHPHRLSQAVAASDYSKLQDHAIDIDAAFHGMIQRARHQRQHCLAIGLDQPEDFSQRTDHGVHLPHFGFLDFLDQSYALPPPNGSDADYPYTCELPPEHECEETHFTVVFMAYNPARLKKLYNQITKMLTDPEFQPLVKEVVVVWNGDRQVEETSLGQALVNLTTQLPIRMSYPLKVGFPNDLLNRYHPRLGITTKAVMYYDDDGPFYSSKATLGGFELWKRNANAQIGAMARRLDLGFRQTEEKKAILNGMGDRFFVSHCPTDELRYNYNIFANFGANMVLPSGSFLHRNYLACIWHPVFEEVRHYVRNHPVNPDDGTVSAIVSHLSGRAPKVYSRRINESDKSDGKKQQRRLLELQPTKNSSSLHVDLLEKESLDSSKDHLMYENYPPQNGDYLHDSMLRRRRLMDGINWDAGGDHAKKMDWGKLRSDAANSLIRYFGSINSGSLGWCYGTKYQDGDSCVPDMARLGKLPWLKTDHTARDVCP